MILYEIVKAIKNKQFNLVGFGLTKGGVEIIEFIIWLLPDRDEWLDFLHWIYTRNNEGYDSKNYADFQFIKQKA